MARIEADVTIERGKADVVLTGALDLYTAHRVGALLRRLIAEGCRDVVVDLAGVERLDAAGVGVLRGASSVLARRGGRFDYRRARDGVVIDLDAHRVQTVVTPTELPLRRPMSGPGSRARRERTRQPQ